MYFKIEYFQNGRHRPSVWVSGREITGRDKAAVPDSLSAMTYIIFYSSIATAAWNLDQGGKVKQHDWVPRSRKGK